MTKREQVLSLWRQGHTKTAIHRMTGVRRGTVIDWIQAAASKGDGASLPPVGNVPPIVAEVMAERGESRAQWGESPPERGESPPGPDRDYKHIESGDTATIECVSPKRIVTLEDAIAFAQVDLTVWRVDKWSCVSWETGMKLRRFDERGKVVQETPHRTHQWRIKLDLRRIMPKSHRAALDGLFAAMKDHAPKYPPIPRRTPPAKPHLCVVDLFDVHFGKLAWAEECRLHGEPDDMANYDLRTAERLYRNAVLDILDESAHREIGEFVIPIGQDFFHIDGFKNETTNGTPQDVDGRLAKIIETGERSVIWAIEQCAAIAPTHVKYVPGNHDRLLALVLTRTIAAWFRNCPNVAVDLAPTTRKAHRFGTTLISFTHGNEEPTNSLASLMANEFKRDFCDTTCHEVHRGHLHRPKQYRTVPVDYQDGVVIRDLMSLSAVDAWHYRKSFIGAPRAAEAYFYSADAGFVAQYVAKARLDPS